MEWNGWLTGCFDKKAASAMYYHTYIGVEISGFTFHVFLVNANMQKKREETHKIGHGFARSLI